MEAAEYLFPRDLEVTPSTIRSVLFIGDCMSGELAKRIGEAGLFAAEHVLFNHVSELPPRSDAALAAIDLQYIRPALRTVLTDAVVRPADFLGRGSFADILAEAEALLDATLEAALAYYRQAQTLTVVGNFIVPQQARISPSLADAGGPADLAVLIARLNDRLAARVAALPGVYLADLDALAATLGKRYFLDDLTFFYAHNAAMPGLWVEPERIEPLPDIGLLYPSQVDSFHTAMIRQIEWILRIAHQIDPVKLVIFDLDNTLWRGTIGDDYAGHERHTHSHGWPGAIWETVHHLRWRGILTAICSKNDATLVAERWDRAVDLPFLALSDFTAARIGWGPKPQSVGELMAEMALTPRSVVVVDDNPVERAAIQDAFPAIRTLGANPFITRRVLLWSAETTPSALSDEGRRRDTMMRGQLDREQTRRAMSREAFLQSLETHIELSLADGSEPPVMGRALELLNRTNQFNTNGRRWSYVKLLAFLRRGRIHLFRVRDRFADYGIVGVVLTRGSEIVQFVMSCRVLGLGVEQAVLAQIAATMRAAGSSEGDVGASIVETESNRPVRRLYADAGFDEIEPGRYLLPAAQTVPQPEHVRIG